MKKFMSLLSIAMLLMGVASSSAFALWGDEETTANTNSYGEETQATDAEAGEARVRAIQLLAKNPDAFSTATKVARQMSAARQQNN